MAKRLAIELFLVLLVGFVLGLIGPFGSFAIPAGPRMAYWMLFSVAGYAMFRPLIIAGRWLAEALGVSEWIGVGAALALAAVPTTFFVSLALNRFDAGAALASPFLGTLYFQVWLVGFLTNGLFTLLFPRQKDASLVPAPAGPAPAEPVPNEPAPSFMDRLPTGFGDLLALKGEDHYVRAIGQHRDELVLLRLRDAIAELPGVEGLQVHRSWWVARAAVAETARDGRAASIILANGVAVPVARDAMSTLKTAGWL